MNKRSEKPMPKTPVRFTRAQRRYFNLRYKLNRLLKEKMDSYERETRAERGGKPMCYNEWCDVLSEQRTLLTLERTLLKRQARLVREKKKTPPKNH